MLDFGIRKKSCAVVVTSYQSDWPEKELEM
jgi:hypothetical protein